MKFTTSTGKFSVEIEGEVAPHMVEHAKTEGVKSELFRGAFPKTEVLMAIETGQTVLSKDGKVKKAENFKRNDVPYSDKLAAQIQAEITAFLPKLGEFTVKVGKYVPSEAGVAAAKNKAIAELSAKLMTEEITLAEFKEQMAALK